MSAELTIGEVARRAGLATSALRYYERVGLLPRPRRESGRRRYREAVVHRLEVIAFAKSAGFTLEEIRTLLDGVGGGARATKRLSKLAQRKLPEVERDLRRLEGVRDLLRAAARCECPDLNVCLSAATD